MAVKINAAQLSRELDLSINSRELKEVAFANAEGVLTEAKEELITKFLEDEVTQEILDGNLASNTSKTLIGVKGKDGKKDVTGNLFSFIGFDEGSDPVGKVVEEINKINITNKRPSKQEHGGRGRFFYSFKTSEFDIEKATNVPKWTGGSWVDWIERGFFNIKHYLHISTSKESHSGTAIQVDGVVSKGAKFSPKRGYFSSIYKRFLVKLQGRDEKGRFS